MKWTPSNLGEVTKFIRNGKSIKQGSGGGLPITRIETIASQKIDLEKFGYAGISDESQYSDWLLKAGDILLSHINSVAHLGKCALYKGNPKKLIHGMNLLNLRPQKSVIDFSYMLFYLRSSYFKNQLPSITNQSVNQSSFSATNLKKLKIPLPPLDIQKKIATVLDKADQLRQKRKKAIEKLDQLVQSVFLDMFGDPVINPKGWATKKLKNLSKLLSGGTPSRKNPEYFFGNIPWITTVALGPKFIDKKDALELITEEAISNSATKIIPKN